MLPFRSNHHARLDRIKLGPTWLGSATVLEAWRKRPGESGQSVMAGKKNETPAGNLVAADLYYVPFSFSPSIAQQPDGTDTKQGEGGGFGGWVRRR